MGLDQYLYKVSREDFERMLIADLLKDGYFRRTDEVYESKYRALAESLSLDAEGDDDRQAMSPGQSCSLSALVEGYENDRRRIAESLGLRWQNGMPLFPNSYRGAMIGRCRNDWDLNSLILSHFWDVDKKGDNMVVVPLDEEAVLLVIEWLRDDEYDNGVEYEHLLSMFSEALEAVRGGSVVYYTPWH